MNYPKEHKIASESPFGLASLARGVRAGTPLSGSELSGKSICDLMMPVGSLKAGISRFDIGRGTTKIRLDLDERFRDPDIANACVVVLTSDSSKHLQRSCVEHLV